MIAEQLVVPLLLRQGIDLRGWSGWTSADWATPWPLVHALERELGPFLLDPCATPRSAKAPAFYTEADDGLQQPWPFGPVFCNPPFNHIKPWVERSLAAARAGVLVAMLLPVRTDTDWWHDLVLPFGEVRYHRGRVHFLRADGRSVGRPRMPTCIVVFRPGWVDEDRCRSCGVLADPDAPDVAW